MRGCATELGYACADSTQHLGAQPVCSVELVWMKSDNRKMNGGSFWPPPPPRGCLSGYGYVVQRKGTNARDSINPHLEIDLGVKQQLRRGEEGRGGCRVDDGTTPTAVWCGSWTVVVEETS